MFIDLTGQRFGRLVVKQRDGSTNRRAAWLCGCDCGETSRVRSSYLLAGESKSCGCLQRETAARRLSAQRLKHGHSRGGVSGWQTRTYSSWQSMIQRCRNPACPQRADYGGRGITVCERWSSFENFLADMGERPDGKTLDRYPNNNGNYEPSNCRWATPKEQAANRRLRKDSKLMQSQYGIQIREV